MSGIRRQLMSAAGAAIALSMTLTACTTAGNDGGQSGSQESNGSEDAATLTIYTDQHRELIDTLTQAYTDLTGIQFDIQQDANFGQVEAEGDASPADIFLSEDPAPVAMLGKAEMTVPIEASTLDQVMDGLNSSAGLWVAYAARTRVLYYNPDLIDEDDLPNSLADVTDPEYADEFAYAPSGAFRATVQYLLSTQGEDTTEEFLEEMKANGVDEHKNGNVRDTVEAGKHAMGLSNHYYWYLKAAEVGGEENMTSKVYHFPQEDPGNLIISSGAAILQSSEQKDEAAEFLSWLTSADGGQQILMHGGIDASGAQYPVARGTASDVVGSLTDIKSPSYDMDIYAEQGETEELLKSLGMTH